VLVTNTGSGSVHNLHHGGPWYREKRLSPEIPTYLEKSFRAPQIPQRPEICQRECETILVLVPYRTHGEAAEFEAYSATIPVVRGLHGSVLQKAQFRIEADIGSGTETLFARVTVTQQEPELVKKLWPENNIRVRGGIKRTSTASAFTRSLEIGITAANRKRAEAIVGQNRTRIEAAAHEIIVDIPLHIGSRAGLNAQARDER